MYAIGEMHQVISETYTLIWVAKQKDHHPIIKKKFSKLPIVNLSLSIYIYIKSLIRL